MENTLRKGGRNDKKSKIVNFELKYLRDDKIVERGTFCPLKSFKEVLNPTGKLANKNILCLTASSIYKIKLHIYTYTYDMVERFLERICSQFDMYLPA